MDTGHKLGLMLLYCVMAGYAVLLLRIVVQIFFRAAIERHRRRKWLEQNAQEASTSRASVGKRGWTNTSRPRSAEVKVATRNDKVNTGLAGATLFKQAIALVSISIALGAASMVAAQQRPARDVSASDLKQQLIDVEVKETALRIPAPAQSQQTQSMTAFAKGHGSIVSAVDERKISAVLVVLRQDGEALITLYSDLQLQVQGTWSASDSAPAGDTAEDHWRRTQR